MGLNIGEGPSEMEENVTLPTFTRIFKNYTMKQEGKETVFLPYIM